MRGARAGHLGVFDSAAALRIAHPEAATPVGSTATVESRKLKRTFRYTLKVNASTKAPYWGGVEA